MLVVVEFTNGPAEVPDPFHDHPHEQVSYIAEGELILFMKGVGEKKLQKGRSICHSRRNTPYGTNADPGSQNYRLFYTLCAKNFYKSK